MENIKTYPEYKDSGVSWLGQVPSHWDKERAKTIFINKKELNKEYQVRNVLSLTLKGVLRNNEEKAIGLVPKDYNTYQIFEKNDLVFKLIDLENYSTSRVGLVFEQGIMSPAYIRLIANTKMYIRYFYFQFYDLWLRGIYNNLGSGVRSTLSARELLNLNVVIPPIEEQNAIVDYLDSKLGKIDEYIAIKISMIEKLQEYLKAYINTAVTKGLNSNVELKDSGVSWFGKIPSHWIVNQMKKFIKQFSNKNMAHLPLLSVVRERGVIERNIEDKEENHNAIPEDLSNYKEVKIGQFVINKMKAWQGSYGVSCFNGIVSPAYFVYDLDCENKKYFNIAVRSNIYVNFFAQYSDGIRIGQWDLSAEKLKTIPFIYPPLEEQQQIVEAIEQKQTVVNTEIDALKKEIDLMKEYRTKLIADVVTGKMDVR